MRVLLTGHDGYIGAVMGQVLEAAGHDVIGLDAFLFEGCTFVESPPRIRSIRGDIRDIRPATLTGFDAVAHLAALSNDPLGELDEALTYEINHQGTVLLARAAKEAGVRRFLFASSCSLYGAAPDDAPLDEEAPFNPVTAYGRTKVLAEHDLAELADRDFAPVFLRNATAYGVSPKLRTDIVLNNLMAYAVTTGEIVIKSDGTPWRPLVHIRDIAATFAAMLDAPEDAIRGQAFNVGRTQENYRISEVAEIVSDVVPGSRIVYTGGGPDARTYRVDFGKLARTLPKLRLTWGLEAGARELADAFRASGATLDDLLGPMYTRLAHIRSRIEGGTLTSGLRDRHDASEGLPDAPGHQASSSAGGARP